MEGADVGADEATSAFRQAFRRHKACKRSRGGGEAAAVEAEVIDLAAPEANTPEVRARIVDHRVAEDTPAWLAGARVRSLRGIDGFRFIECPFSPVEQLHLARAALRDWPEPPAATNLGLPPPAGFGPGPHRQLWEAHCAAPAGGERSLLSRLSWATLGYHYQWSSRAYDPGKRCAMPAALSELAADFASACGWAGVRPEAAIVNYYGATSTMGAHYDDAEPCQTAPIVSISLGLSAVYLLGGETHAHPPVAIWLRSGDVVVQGGESRSFVHGVPRIVAGSVPAQLESAAASSAGGGEADAADLGRVARWLQDHRINVNVRQVHGC